MRIGFDARLPYYQMGGISQYILHLLPALAEVDQQNQYLIFQNGRDRRYLAPQQANFKRKFLWTPSHHRWERWTAALEIAPQRLDIMHSPDFIPPRFGARRRVVTIHDLNFIYYPQFLTKESMRYYAEQIEWAVHVADHISADSHATRYDLIEKLAVPAEKVTTIHLAANPIYEIVYPETAVSATLKKHNLPHGYILFVGTLEPRKNIPFLLHAYRQLRRESDIDVPLVLVGSKGWLYEEVFNTISSLGLESNVIHLQGIFNEELAHLYRGAGVLVTPSHYEGFGLPALEAMHCGCPAVVSNRGSLPEVVGTAGMTLDLQDEAEWADALMRVLTNNELRERMIAAGKTQAQTFNWRRTAEETLSIYNMMAN